MTIASSAVQDQQTQDSPSQAEFTVLIDNECPLCKKEGELLLWLDKGRGRLALVDITEPEFDAAEYGTTFEHVMGTIHGVTEKGGLVTGMEVFRRAYAAVGWGWLWAPTGWPGIKAICDAGYRWFAKHRLRLTGRPDACEQGRCRVPGDAPAA
ncbi:MAG: DUF393 domain-containing protein [Planctomycetota bacterium]